MAARVIRPDWRKVVQQRVRRHEVRKGLAYAGQYAMGEREGRAASRKDAKPCRSVGVQAGWRNGEQFGLAAMGSDELHGSAVRPAKANGHAIAAAASPNRASVSTPAGSQAPARPSLSPLLILCGFFFLLAAALFLLPLRKGVEPWMACVGFASSAVGIAWASRELVKWKP